MTNYFRSYCIRDTFIDKNNPLNNYGDDHVNNLSVTSNSVSSIFTHCFYQFDLNNSLTSNLSGTYTSILNIFNCRNYEYTDENFYIEIYPITGTTQWIEGKGQLIYPLTGATNWNSLTQTQNWSVSGGDYISSPSASVLFSAGTENLTANISAFIEYWKTNPNYGLLLKYPNSIESSTSNYENYKSFYNRNTITVFKPYIEFVYQDSIPYIFDDVNNLHYGVNNFYIYDNNVSGSSYPGVFFIKFDSTSTADYQYFPTFIKPNVWSISFTSSSIAYDELYFCYSNTAIGYSVTASVTGSQLFTSFESNNSSYIKSSFIGLEEYRNDEEPILRTKIYHNINYRMGNVATNYFPDSVYLYLIEKNTRLRFTPDLQMNYDSNSFFLSFDMSNLIDSYYYIPCVKIVDKGNIILREMPEAEFYVRKIM